MFILTAGVLLWSAAHLLGRLAPGLRDRLGGRAGMGLISLAATAMMVFGYRAAEGEFWWGRDPMTTGINNLLMLVSVWLFAAAGMKTWIARQIRHPMLWGVVIWMVAHLLVNGDTPSFVLFGGIGIWALLQMVVINRTGPWERPEAKPGKSPARMEAIAIAGALVVYGAIAGVHYALGYAAFG
ncbi:NnrU family protein [Pseudogemmobacter bohemicus]|uniref:NnrU family protein n=1 Tax=Pseudogemmobacter bohemicus TaxID=2250708 RepID=UPI000DD4D0C7|nr:NnrU family protein [Pseudogemmobacter bohemicus]